MTRSFRDSGSEDVFYGWDTKVARTTLPRQLWTVASRKLDQLDSAEELDDLRIPPGIRLEGLREDGRDNNSIRINDQNRICFEWSQSGPENVEIVDYH